jgi:hypothetical protein
MPPLKLMILAASMLLSACVVAPYPRHGGYYAPGPVGSVVVMADIPPPAPYVEVIPAMPYPGAVWLGGYWGWGGGRHQWVPGRWEQPRPGYAWHPYAWAPHGGRWQLNAGGWVAH